ncbi:MAG: hypothetical protein V4510_09690 [bacterium]
MNKRQRKKAMKRIFARIEAHNRRPETAAALAAWEAEAERTWPARRAAMLESPYPMAEPEEHGLGPWLEAVERGPRP